LDNESRKYLTSIADIVNNLQWAKLKAEIWCEDMHIEDPHTVTNCMVMAMLWGAALRDHPITQREVLHHLGIEESEVDFSEGYLDEGFFLHPDLQALSFDDLMDNVSTQS
jgi:hypothetical protein